MNLGASAATIVGKGLIYAGKQNAVLAKALKESGTKVLPTPTAIVDAAALAVTIVDLLNGFGSPNSGSAVSTAADKLDLFIKDLDPGALPDPRDWSGTAATAYAGQVALLKGYATTMKEYDKILKGYLAEQAAAVKQAHLCCNVNVAVLTAAAGIALAMYLIPIAGPGISQAWQIIAAFACCAAVFVVEMLTLSSSMGLSNQLSTLGQKYVELGKDVDTKLAGSFGKIEGKVLAETSNKLSGFRAVSDGLTDYSFAAAPTVSKLGAAAGDKASPAQKAVLESNSQVAAKSSADTKTDTPTKTSDKTPTPAAYTPPSLAQIGQASQGLNQVSQTLSQGMQQIQSLAQSAKGSAPAAAPVAAHDVSDVKDEDAKKDEEAKAGAAAGKDGTERAPVDAAAPAAAAPAAAGRERVL
ncbi:EspA/EspE family type VII secretion system effector [Mycobacterium sp. Aquia_216]|uniref:EspA/EspE family type VII secretion system effector n=1 Tax=Mycobacterium sp. Aquia_216 TaxID=2991729 RepID=UPI00227CC497|nr:EspA/EspE family type VII secretion system effector [Mycobacterium sp. Aquia_216]WAJ45169.1 EspA/EspE family type VII secretion system effector [Mycobacterium sp. Aquia_216]